MPTYVYGCGPNDHPRKTITHPVGAPDIDLVCEECGKPLHRIPQAFRWYMNPSDVLYDHMDDEYRKWRTEQHGRGKQKAN